MQNATLIATGAIAIAVAALASAMGGPKAEPAARSLAPPAVVTVGAVAPVAGTHLIERPGLYGLGTPPAEGQYAIISGALVRLDPTTMVVRSIIRREVHPVD